jgi:hypothetical protein
MRDPESTECSDALQRLVEHGPEARDVAPELWKILAKAKAPFRGELIAALWKIERPWQSGELQRDARPLLLSQLRQMLRTEDNADVQAAALSTIVGIGRPAGDLARDAIKCLDVYDVEPIAIQAVHAIGPAAKDAIPRLIRFANSDDLSVQKLAIAAICRIQPGHAYGIQRLKELCETEDDLSILLYLDPADLGNAKITPILRRAIYSMNPHIVDHSLKLLQATDPEAFRKLRRENSIGRSSLGVVD